MFFALFFLSQENEKDYLPWEAAISNLGYIRGIISQTSHYGDYMKYLKKIAKKTYDVSNANRQKLPKKTSFYRLKKW